MRKKFEAMVIRLRSAVHRHPVEVAEAVFYCVMAFVYYEFEYESLKNALVWFPALFLFTYSLNGMTLNRKLRPVYFLSFFCFIPLIGMKADIWTPVYWVTLVVAQLFYLISSWQRENDLFIRSGLRYFRALLSAGLLAGIAYLLAVSIYYSVRYIFEFGDFSETSFLIEASYVIFICGMPLLFLMFSEEKEEEEQGNRLFEVLLNYVLSPALLIYAVILYLYFIKITVLWSLPKGAVAYIVVSFVTATFILRGCQIFLDKRHYDWYYRRASIAVLPALIMYWVGVYYRINQYGYTELRVYLVVVGLILTGMALLFFVKRWGRYLYVGCLAFILLSIVTYIPGITAKDIEKYSQAGRGNDLSDGAHSDDKAYLSIDHVYPVDIASYQTLIPISNYKGNNKGELWSETRMDSLYIFNKKDEVVYADGLASIWNRQMARVDLNPGDSIPEKDFSKLLELDLDSAKVIFETIGLNRSDRDSAYRISFIVPAYYLKK